MKAAAARSPSGMLPAADCPLLYADEDPRNVWALEGRFAAPTRTVSLPLLGLTATMQQSWSDPSAGGRAGGGRAERRTAIEGHSTAAVCCRPHTWPTPTPFTSH